MQLVDKALVVAAVEVRGTASGRVRLQVVPDASGASLTGFVRNAVEHGALVVTDGWQGYAPLTTMGYRHRARTQGDPRRAEKLLPRVHRVFGNLKAWLVGTHHGVAGAHLQVYLDEFTFRFNRRRTPRWRRSKRSWDLRRFTARPRTTGCMLRSEPDKHEGFYVAYAPDVPACTFRSGAALITGSRKL